MPTQIQRPGQMPIYKKQRPGPVSRDFLAVVLMCNDYEINCSRSYCGVAEVALFSFGVQWPVGELDCCAALWQVQCTCFPLLPKKKKNRNRNGERACVSFSAVTKSAAKRRKKNNKNIKTFGYSKRKRGMRGSAEIRSTALGPVLIVRAVWQISVSVSVTVLAASWSWFPCEFLSSWPGFFCLRPVSSACPLHPGCRLATK